MSIEVGTEGIYTRDGLFMCLVPRDWHRVVGPPTFSATGTSATCPSTSMTSPYCAACLQNSVQPEGGFFISLDWAMDLDWNTDRTV